MSAELRKELEKEVLKELQSMASSCLDSKAGKNKLTLFGLKEKSAEIYIQYLPKADGYYAGLEVFKCEAMDFCTSQSPPYASRLMNSSFLSKSSLSERDKEFGDEIGGIVRTPTPQNIKSTAGKMRQRLEKFYLPEAENCITGSVSLIDDVLAAPDNYAYPFLAMLFCARKNDIDLNSVRFQEILGTKKIFGNKQFDLALARKILG